MRLAFSAVKFLVVLRFLSSLKLLENSRFVYPFSLCAFTRVTAVERVLPLCQNEKKTRETMPIIGNRR